jgi:hypothetical protein
MVRNCLVSALLEECLAVRYWAPEKKTPRAVSALAAAAAAAADCVRTHTVGHFLAPIYGHSWLNHLGMRRALKANNGLPSVSLEIRYFSPLSVESLSKLKMVINFIRRATWIKFLSRWIS